jgi:hypothetical protein
LRFLKAASLESILTVIISSRTGSSIGCSRLAAGYLLGSAIAITYGIIFDIWISIEFVTISIDSGRASPSIGGALVRSSYCTVTGSRYTAAVGI